MLSGSAVSYIDTTLADLGSDNLGVGSDPSEFRNYCKLKFEFG